MKLSFTFQAIDTYTKEEAIQNTYLWLKNMNARNVCIEETVVKCNASESLTDKIYKTIQQHGEFRGVLSMIENGEETWHAPCHIEDDMEFTWEEGTMFLQVKVKDHHAYTQELISWMTSHSGIPYDQVDHIFFFQFENQDAVNAATKYLPNQDFFSNIVSLSTVENESASLPSDIDSRDYPIRSDNDEIEYQESYDEYAETPALEMSETDVDMLLASCIPCLLQNWDNTDAHHTMNAHGYPVTRRLTSSVLTMYVWHNQKIVRTLEYGIAGYENPRYFLIKER